MHLDTRPDTHLGCSDAISEAKLASIYDAICIQCRLLPQIRCTCDSSTGLVAEPIKVALCCIELCVTPAARETCHPFKGTMLVIDRFRGKRLPLYLLIFFSILTTINIYGTFYEPNPYDLFTLLVGSFDP